MANAIWNVRSSLGKRVNLVNLDEPKWLGELY